MSDDELVLLERAVAERGDAPSRLRLARALERVGRSDDALDTLLPAKHHPEVRLAIAKFPSWSRDDGGLAGTRHADVRPLVAKPRVKWSKEMARDTVLASPLGLVTFRTDGMLAVADADDGAMRTVGRGALPIVLGDVVVAQRLVGKEVVLEGRDIWTGELFFETPLARPVWIGDGRLLVSTGGKLVARAFPDPRRAPCDELWSARVPKGSFVVQAACDLVFVRTGVDVRAFDASSGKKLWSLGLARACSDGRDVLAVSSGEASVSLLDARTGKPRWTHEAAPPLFLLGPELVVLSQGLVARRADHVVLDRATGSVLSQEAGRAVALARDTLYVVDRRTLMARDGRGAVLWRSAFNADPKQVTPSPGRVYVLDSRGSISCLEEVRGA